MEAQRLDEAKKIVENANKVKERLDSAKNSLDRFREFQAKDKFSVNIGAYMYNDGKYSGELYRFPLEAEYLGLLEFLLIQRLDKLQKEFDAIEL